MTISPQGVIDAGAQWRRVGNPTWRNSGYTESGLPVGEYTVTFKDVSGWTKPANRSVTIYGGQTTNESGTYTPILYGGGSGTADDPFQINAVSHWQNLMNRPDDWDKHFIVTDDINLNDVTVTPIGNSTDRFTGEIDGDDYVIRNVDINMPGGTYVGLLGFLGSEGQIKNLGVVDVSISGDQRVGGLAGQSFGTISNCYSTGLITGHYLVGGLAGDSYGTISNCYSTGLISGHFSVSVGGLVGRNYFRYIINSYSTASVNGWWNVGGLVGENWGGQYPQLLFNRPGHRR